MSFFDKMWKFFDRIGVFGRLLFAVIPMLIVVMVGIGIGGDEETAMIIRIPVILGSLFIFSMLIFFVQDDGES